MGLLRPTLIGSALGLLLVACSAPDPPEGEFPAVDTGSADSGDNDASADVGDVSDTGGAEVVPTMDGYWMHYDQVVSCVDFIGQ